ncbi:MAG: ABC transporter ATP-binding protein [Acutalibacteraceae bacterium]|nr:ABC transporter ATP-binding protein [Acutalibacteraceae bacterium]
MSLVLKNISKSYGKKKALNNFNAELNNGVYGFLGPNGAGKTTLINIIVGLISADKGSIIYNGENVKDMGKDFLNKIGYMPQYPGFYKNYTAREYLKYISVIKGIDKALIKNKVDEILTIVNLKNAADKKIGGFSGGMRQRLGIAQAIINNPDVLILDEPTAGLDPKERIHFRNLISRLSENRTVILSTHIVPDIEYISNEVILIGSGEKIIQTRPADLTKQIEGSVWKVEVEDEKDVQKYMQNYSITNVVRSERYYSLRIVSTARPCNDAVNIIPSLEDVYLYCFEGNNKL